MRTATGCEGAFATWDWDELGGLVGPAVAEAFGATPEGNWEGTNVLWRPTLSRQVAAAHGRSVGSARAGARRGARDARGRPRTTGPAGHRRQGGGRVERACDHAARDRGRRFDEPSLLDAAVRCGATFVWERMRVDGTDSSEPGEMVGRPGPAFLDDHALLGLGMLSLFETTATSGGSIEPSSSPTRSIGCSGRDGPAQTGRRRRGARSPSPGADRRRDAERSVGRRRIVARLSHLTGKPFEETRTCHRRTGRCVARAGAAGVRPPLVRPGHARGPGPRGRDRRRSLAPTTRARSPRRSLAARYLPNTQLAIGAAGWRSRSPGTAPTGSATRRGQGDGLRLRAFRVSTPCDDARGSRRPALGPHVIRSRRCKAQAHSRPLCPQENAQCAIG